MGSAAEFSWANLGVELGSDHYIVSTVLQVGRKPPRTFKYIDWDYFHKIREERGGDYPENFQEWLDRVKRDVEEATKSIDTELEVDKMDSRLAHLLEAKESLLARWRTQKLNRRLRKRLAGLNKAIMAHCQVLERQQWHELCNMVDGQMRIGAKWNILKHMLHENKTKINQNRVVDRILHAERQLHRDDEIAMRLARRYLPLAENAGPPETKCPQYEGRSAEGLDRSFQEADVRETLQKLNGRSAPGPDGVTNKMLRNLDDKSIRIITAEINRIWEAGVFPDEWKVASVVLIPKPGRSPGAENLRPISLTSCLGKVAEHVINDRISKHIEDARLFPNNLIGFRPHLSTQDVMLLIKHDILDNDTRDTRAILGLDLEKAFDNVSHRHILDSISRLNLGERFYNFVQSFLGSRRATIKLGDLRSQAYDLGHRGTPQGSVISPLLFNIAMQGLADELEQMGCIGSAIYADDIALWCSGGSDGYVEDAMQEAVHCVEKHASKMGLRLSPSKSELLIYRPTRRGPKPQGWKPLGEIDIGVRTSSGCEIPRVSSLRVLGMIIEANGQHGRTIDKLTGHAEGVIRLIARVSNKRGGLKEDNLLRLFHAFLMSHVNYVIPMHRWQKHEINKLNTLIRKSIKRVLGLPMRTSTENLASLGVHNTLEEVIEAQQSAHIARLSSTSAGRGILAKVGINPTALQDRNVQLSDSVRQAIQVSPIPRNVHPVFNTGRRTARASALLRYAHAHEAESCFVDAAQYEGDSSRFVANVVDMKGRVLSAVSIRTSSACKAEQMAIALALLSSDKAEIFTDSRSALRAFSTGAVCEEVARALEGKMLTRHTITWFPAHEGAEVGGLANVNELAHARARGLAGRAGHREVGVQGGTDAGLGPTFSEADPPRFRDILCTFNEITSHYRMSRRIFPSPHRNLTRPQAVTLRQIQTNSYVTLSALSRYTEVSPLCPDCGRISDFKHMLWECPSLQCHTDDGLTPRIFYSFVKSHDWLEQLRAVQKAHDAAIRLGLPVPTWEPPAVLPL